MTPAARLITRIGIGTALAGVVAACAGRAPAVMIAPDDATCRLVLDTTVQRVQPRYLSGPMPKYPRGLLGGGVQGQVMLQFELGCNGIVRPASLEVLSATRREFVEPAVKATLGARFAPALVEGRPVAVRIKQSVRFTIGRSVAVFGK